MSAPLQINNYNTRNIFIWNDRYNSISANYTNPSNSVAATLLAGTIVGRVAATGNILPSVSTATDGSQVPIGILADSYTVPASGSVAVTFGIQGDVDRNAIIFFNGTDTLATVISVTDSASNTVKLGTIGDLLNGKGILPITSNEMTYLDNQ